MVLDPAKYKVMPLKYKLARFSLLLLRAYPFLGELCARVEKPRKEQRAVASTDGLRIFLNEEKMQELIEETFNFVMLHELIHILLRQRYPKNMPFFEKPYWNRGFDLVANWLIMSMATELKRKGLPVIPIADAVLSTDNLSEDPSNRISTAFVRQAIEQGILSESPPLFVEIKWKSYEGIILNDNSFIFDVLGDDDTDSAPTEAEIQALLEDCAKSAGKDGLPRILKDLWDGLRKGRELPWYLVFKRWLEGMKESEDYDFCPPDKRMLYSGMMLPAPTLDDGEELNNALMVLDVSDSVDREELLAQTWQVNSILKGLEFRGSIISFASAVYQEASLSTRASLKRFIDDLEVGGGTNWADVVEYVKKEKPLSRPIIVFTDGYLFSYTKGLSNVVFITQNDYPEQLAKLGKVIQIPNKPN